MVGSLASITQMITLSATRQVRVSDTHLSRFKGGLGANIHLLIFCPTGVITLTSSTVDDHSSVELAHDSCGKNALALLEDPDSAPGQVIAAKHSQLKQIVKKFDLYVDKLSIF